MCLLGNPGAGVLQEQNTQGLEGMPLMKDALKITCFLQEEESGLGEACLCANGKAKGAAKEDRVISLMTGGQANHDLSENFLLMV